MNLGKAGLLIIYVVCLASCGSDSSPAAPTPTTAQVAGVWRGTSRIASISGGECFATALQTSVGAGSPITVAATQSGSSVSATLTTDADGGNYTYSGTVGQSAVSLTGSACSACNTIGARCPTSTALRDLKIQTASVTGTVSGATLTGSETETYNLFNAGTATAVGTYTVTSSFTLTRQ